MFKKNDLIKLFSSLLSVRKFIAVILTMTFCVIALCGVVSSTEYTTVFTMVIGFYFGRSTALDVPGKQQAEGNEENV